VPLILPQKEVICQGLFEKNFIFLIGSQRGSESRRGAMKKTEPHLSSRHTKSRKKGGGGENGFEPRLTFAGRGFREAGEKG
jgi:hypothetical protein